MRHTPHALALSLASLLAACSPPSETTTGEGGHSEPTAPTGGSGAGGTAGSGATAGSGGAGGETPTGAGGTSTGGNSTGGASTGGAGTGGDAPTWGPDQCPSPPDGVTVGIEVGQQLPELVVKDCDGNDYSLSELCGANGLWLFAAHGWCPLCQNVSSSAEAIHDSFAAQGLATAIIVVETGSSQPPGANYCKTWRDQFGLVDVVTLYDPTGAILEVWPGPSSSLSAFVDSNRVIVSKLYHDGNIATIEANIQEALDQ